MNRVFKALGKARRFLFCLVLVAAVSGCLPVASPGASTVDRIVDGDTIVLSTGERLRYIGIDTPEMSPLQPFAKEATEANRKLVGGKEIRLEKDVSETDRYDRLLRYVWVDSTMVNLELVRLGLAESKAYPPDTRYQTLLDAAELEAKLAGRGMWAK